MANGRCDDCAGGYICEALGGRCMETPVVPRSDGERERRIADIRTRVAEAAAALMFPAPGEVPVMQMAAVEDMEWLLSLLLDLREETAAMREALHPFAEFATMWDAKPLRGTADAFYGIHHGTEWEATLKVSDCRKAAKVLGYASAAVARETGE